MGYEAIMRTFDVARCIIDLMTHRDLNSAHNGLYRAGLAVSWIRAAAAAVDEQNGDILNSNAKVVQYHTYVGVSAPRTAIDATAVWLHHLLTLPPTHPTQIDLVKPKFRTDVIARLPHAEAELQSLGDLADLLDRFRQAAQHRGIVTPIFVSLRLGEAGRWCFELQDMKLMRKETIRLDQDIVCCLESWAGQIEANLCALAKMADDAGFLGVDQSRP